jgi:hypothetical protein
MKTAPLPTQTLLQLLTAARIPASHRAAAEAAHNEDEPVTLNREDDFTFTLAFESGDTLRLSYQQGNELHKSLERAQG